MLRASVEGIFRPGYLAQNSGFSQVFQPSPTLHEAITRSAIKRCVSFSVAIFHHWQVMIGLEARLSRTRHPLLRVVIIVKALASKGVVTAIASLEQTVPDPVLTIKLLLIDAERLRVDSFVCAA